MKQSFIFLHGGPGFKDYLQPYFQELNDTFDCHFYDQLQGPNVTLEDLIVQLDKKVKLLSKPVLIGHSWGGVLATEFALRAPEKVGGLVVMCSALSHSQWLGYHKELKEMNLEGAGPDKIFLVPDDLEYGRKFLDQTWTTFSNETFDNLNHLYIKNFDLTKRLNEISLKFLNIYAEKDLRIPPRIAKIIQNFNTSIINHQILGAGHFPFLQSVGRKKIYQILRNSF